MSVVKEWTTAAGYDANIFRVDNMGHPCGYVTIPEHHPLASLSSEVEAEERYGIEVHDGVTYFKLHEGHLWTEDEVAAECEYLAARLLAIEQYWTPQ